MRKTIAELLQELDKATNNPWHRIVMFGDRSGHIELAAPGYQSPTNLGSFWGRAECETLLKQLIKGEQVCPTCKKKLHKE